MKRKIIEVIKGRNFDTPPVWLMRQAGRYLPEYRQTRKKAGGFLDLCYNPELAIEVTLQPIRRFGFDAAILFSDILVIPDALGQPVRFEEGVGPLLEPIDQTGIVDLQQKDKDEALEWLHPVLETVSGLRAELPEETTLLGFCGAPWTVATYMIAGKGTPDQAPARLFAFEQERAFADLIDKLIEVSAAYLIAQLKAGADAVQIFDSWAGILDEEQFKRWTVKPVKKIVENVRAEIPDAKIIGFPKGAGSNYEYYRQKTGIDMLGLDWNVSADFARQLQQEGAVQGNLDPLRLIAGGDALKTGVEKILENLGGRPFVFNLGHGITPQTPIAHVEEMLKLIRG